MIPSPNQTMQPTDMKQRFVSLGVGLLILAAVFGLTIAGQFSPAITLILSDERLFYVLGAILIFCAAFLLGGRGHFGIWDAVLLYLPLAGAFALTTLRELPFMWPTLPLDSEWRDRSGACVATS
jgi:hypothetical protein